MVQIEQLMDVLQRKPRRNQGKIQTMEWDRWVMGVDIPLPIQVEKLEAEDQIILYVTALREKQEVVLAPLIVTLFLEGLSGSPISDNPMGRLGICPGPVTITVFQRLNIGGFSPARLSHAVNGFRRAALPLLESARTPDDPEDEWQAEGAIENTVLHIRH